MASNIVISKIEGVGPAATTIYRNADAAKAAGDRKPYWTSFEMSSADAWEKITPAGFSSIDPKFMGGKTNQITINGVIVDPNDNAENILVGMKDILRLNKSRMTVLVKMGNIPISDGITGAIVTTCTAGPFGDGTGPRCPFTITFKNVGPDSDTPAI